PRWKALTDGMFTVPFRLGAYQQAEIIQRTQVLGTGSQPRNQVPQGRPRVNLVQIGFSRSAGVDSIRRKQVSAQGRSRTSPVGTAECSPGRQSWVAITTRNSPAGTTESQSCPNCIFSISRRGQHSQKTSQRSTQIANQSRRDGRV